MALLAVDEVDVTPEGFLPFLSAAFCLRLASIRLLRFATLDGLRSG
jgi:hypothetical protein